MANVMSEGVPVGISKKNRFGLGYQMIASCDFGDLVPVVMKEMVPGDTFNCGVNSFVRFAPLACPTYGRIKGNINYFFVPARILMPENSWQDSITGGTDGSHPARFPFISSSAVGTLYQYLDEGSVGSVNEGNVTPRMMDKLFTYLGLPPAKEFAADRSQRARISLLPFLAYNRIYGDYYYPYGLENDDMVREYYHRKWSGTYGNTNSNWESVWPYLLLLMVCHKTCYTKDYFTTAFVRPQRGGEVYAPTYEYDTLRPEDNGAVVVHPDNTLNSGQDSNFVSALAMKLARSVQKFLERNNVAGGRYFEQMLARFGVKIPAERLDRSQWLGGNDFYCSVSDVTSTASTQGASLGDMAGKGIGNGNGTVSYTAVEHGFFVALMHILPETGYYQGINRMWTREDKFDYFTPELEDTGMQPIYNRELRAEIVSRFGSFNNAAYNSVFGYAPRYSEYKYSSPIVAGDFRIYPSVGSVEESGAYARYLDSMHLFRVFSPNQLPVLSPSFVTVDAESNGGFDRIFQDQNTDYDHLYCDITVSLDALRPMIGFAESALSMSNEDDDNNSKVSVPYGGVRL